MNFERSVHKKHRHLFDFILDDVVTLVSLLYIILLIAELSYIGNVNSNLSIIIVDTAVSILFLFEFFYFFFKSNNKKDYFKHHGIDLIASIPYIFLLNISGLFFLFNIFKIIRGLKSVIKLYEFIFKIKLPLIFKILMLFVLVILFFAIMIVQVEKGENPNLQTFQDGLWWALVTIATVGYGDVVPITMGGRILTFFLVFTGMGLTSSIGALFAIYLLKPSVEKRYESDISSIKEGEDRIKNKEDTIANKEEIITSMENRIISRLDKLENKMTKNKTNSKTKINRREKNI